MKLDTNGSGSIEKEEFMQIPTVANNPLALRLIAIFDEKYVPPLFLPAYVGHGPDFCFPIFSGTGTVDFIQFVKGLSAFSSNGSAEEKLRCTSCCFIAHSSLGSSARN